MEEVLQGKLSISSMQLFQKLTQSHWNLLQEWIFFLWILASNLILWKYLFMKEKNMQYAVHINYQTSKSFIVWNFDFKKICVENKESKIMINGCFLTCSSIFCYIFGVCGKIFVRIYKTQCDFIIIRLVFHNDRYAVLLKYGCTVFGKSLPSTSKLVTSSTFTMKQF